MKSAVIMLLQSLASSRRLMLDSVRYTSSLAGEVSIVRVALGKVSLHDPFDASATAVIPVSTRQKVAAAPRWEEGLTGPGSWYILKLV
jgi:hypothetical protein